MQEIQTVRAPGGAADRNLTEFEYLALRSRLNVADGHARQALTDSQARIIDDLPNLFAKAAALPPEEVELAACRAYLGLLGQHSHPHGEGRVLACYSSSVAMEIFARALARSGDAVALIHPTFDNIPDILRGVGLRLIPLEEDRVHDGDLDPALLNSVRCVFLTTPNNPTGRVVSETRLRALAAQCADHDVVLALDTSFRGFDPRAHYDHYRVLESSGCRWVVIEDTGKLWPTLELKIGWLMLSENLDLPVAKVYSDILLGASPLVLALVQRFAEDAADGGLADLHDFIAGNRGMVRRELSGLPEVSFPDVDSRVSVERVHLGSRAALDVWSALCGHNVYTLPCQKFHWARPAEGDHFLRLALARSSAPLHEATRLLRDALAAT